VTVQAPSIVTEAVTDTATSAAVIAVARARGAGGTRGKRGSRIVGLAGRPRAPAISAPLSRIPMTHSLFDLRGCLRRAAQVRHDHGFAAKRSGFASQF
jgi:hypothetical protein